MPSLPGTGSVDRTLFEEGHLWLLEYVAGEPFRFQLQPSGLIRFGDGSRTYQDPDSVPRRYGHAVSHIQHHLNRDALRDALTDPTDITFFGIATQRDSREYRWHELPSFLGMEVWSASRESCYPPDVAHQIFEAINLDPLPPVEQEVHPRDFDVDAYEVPTSYWSDAPAAGVVIWNKGGGRALLRSNQSGRRPTLPDSAELLVDEITQPVWRESVVSDLRERGQAVTVDALIEEFMRIAWRVYHPALTDSQDSINQHAVRDVLAREAAILVNDRSG